MYTFQNLRTFIVLTTVIVTSMASAAYAETIASLGISNPALSASSTPQTEVQQPVTGSTTVPSNSSFVVPEPLICVALTLEPGTRSNDVKNIQRWLISQGYTKVVATGLYDILTVRAVTHFQNEYAVTILAPLGLTQATGTWGEYTARQASRMGLCQFDDYADDSDLPVSVPASGRLPASSSYTNDAYPGVCLAKTMGLVGTQDARHNTREDVKKLQNFLRSRGYTKVEATGIYGPLTKRAIAHFQEEYAESILHPLGRKKGTGVWGVRTALLATELGLCEF